MITGHAVNTSLWARLQHPCCRQSAHHLLPTTSCIVYPTDLQPFDDGDVGLTAAFAHRLQAVPAATALQLMQQGGH